MLNRRELIGTGSLALAGFPMIAKAQAGDLIADVQQRTFRYFWDTTDARTGLAPDRWPMPPFASIAAVGFALTAYPIGVVNGWITRDQARERTLTTLDYFTRLPMGPGSTGVSGYNGFFYHFLDMKTGHRFGRCELSTIDTVLFLAGVLFVREWFDGRHPDEVRIRALADQLYAAVDWQWAVVRPPFIAMGWHPETGFIASDWNIYNEGMLLYLFALGSPTHALPGETWTALTDRFAASWSDQWGKPHLAFAPLFGHQYSHLWCDFRGIRDRFIATKNIDYFENSARATWAQRDYAIANPGRWVGYGAEIWGLTACDGPGDFDLRIMDRQREFFAYSARGPGERDDGTIAPTAALGSIAFAPDIVVPCARAMVARYRAGIYARYGFLDSFNPTLTMRSAPIRAGRVVPGFGWTDSQYLGIDQGPIVGGIENERSGLVWQTMHNSIPLRRGLQAAGFTGGWLGRKVA